MTGQAPQLQRLVGVMARLRQECPWDAEQTHRSLTKHLIEEAAEVVDAIETAPSDEGIDDDDLREELGDLLLQVYFHAEIASQTGRFTIDDVAREICDKLERRHPWVFAGEDDPADMMASWEAAKRAEKQRRSALSGIPRSLPTLARAAKVVARIEHVHLPVEMASEPITAEQAGAGILALVQRAQASGVDADQATRDAVRDLESRAQAAEGNPGADG